MIWANGNPGEDTITLPAGTYTLTLGAASEDNAATGDLDVRESLTINGAGARTTIINGNANDRIFDLISNLGDLTLSDMTLRNGNSGGADGGAIKNVDNTLTLTDVTLSGNTAAGRKGGAISIDAGDAQLNVNRATFNNNSADQGGAIYGNGVSVLVQITNATFNGNSATTVGGAFSITHAALVNTTIEGNTAPSDGGVDKSGGSPSPRSTQSSPTTRAAIVPTPFDSGSNNIDSDGSCGFATTADPKLGPLQNNTGPTDTMALLPGSPAIESGTNTGCPTEDQRSMARPDGVLCDVGAYEAEVAIVSGTVFEDVNYGGGAGRDQATSSGVARSGARVELYDDDRRLRQLHDHGRLGQLQLRRLPQHRTTPCAW